MTPRPVLLPLNERARMLAETLDIDAELMPVSRFKSELAVAFGQGRPIVAICATGIVVRLLAPLLGDKRSEPPVVVVAPDGGAVVPLLGGHHGANALADELGEQLGIEPAITTASDAIFGLSLEEPPAGYRLGNPEHIKPFTARLLDGARIRLEGNATWLTESALPFADNGALRILVTDKAVAGNAETLVYHPSTLALGIGCERCVPAEEVDALVRDVLRANELSPLAVAGVFSLDIKKDEDAMHAVAEGLGVPARFFDRATLATESERLATPSAVVEAEVGVPGVAEAAALAAASRNGTLIVPKVKSRRATCAVARAEQPLDADGLGQARGQLAIVGIGPGQAEWRTREAESLIREADTVIGYRLYLDLVDDLTGGATIVGYELGEEETRVRDALDRAAKGDAVALVSSGDAGIFAMSALAHELLADGQAPDGWRRIRIVNAPGISAMQAAAARIGAPLGHDFCAISLSDLLTPREVILKRIEAAGQGDFVIAFYNPVSKRRRELLARARDMLLRHRPAGTPVVIARNLGRPGESVRAVTLADLKVDDVDMLSLVLIGASQTARGGDDKTPFVYTPRGYPLRAVEDAS